MSDIMVNIIAVLISIGVIVSIVWTFVYVKRYFIETNNLKVVEVICRVEDIVLKAVRKTNQTYVDELKANGKFDTEAHKTALTKTKATVMALLTEETKETLMTVFGSIDSYIETLIESTVNNCKNN